MRDRDSSILFFLSESSINRRFPSFLRKDCIAEKREDGNDFERLIIQVTLYHVQFIIDDDNARSGVEGR